MADDRAEWFEEHPGILSDTRDYPVLPNKQTIKIGRGAEDRINRVARERMQYVRDGGHVTS